MFLLDTSVVSEAQKARPDPSVIGWLHDSGVTNLFLSVMVVGELRRGVERLRRRDTKRADRLDTWTRQLVSDFGERIVPVTLEIADRWGRLGVPDPVPAVDGLLAATALVHDWTLVTRNERDLARTGVRLVNPFS